MDTRCCGETFTPTDLKRGYKACFKCRVISLSDHPVPSRERFEQFVKDLEASDLPNATPIRAPKISSP
jgi:hypothetical protein